MVSGIDFSWWYYLGPGNLYKLKAFFFFTNKTGVPAGELLVRINPLFSNSFKVFCNINNLSRVVPYKRPYGGVFFFPVVTFF